MRQKVVSLDFITPLTVLLEIFCFQHFFFFVIFVTDDKGIILLCFNVHFFQIVDTCSLDLPFFALSKVFLQVKTLPAFKMNKKKIA